jgi:hypothetical protein
LKHNPESDAPQTHPGCTPKHTPDAPQTRPGCTPNTPQHTPNSSRRATQRGASIAAAQRPVPAAINAPLPQTPWRINRTGAPPYLRSVRKGRGCTAAAPAAIPAAVPAAVPAALPASPAVGPRPVAAPLGLEGQDRHGPTRSGPAWYLLLHRWCRNPSRNRTACLTDGPVHSGVQLQ